MTISEIVKENSRIAHLNAVQLSWYPNSPDNTALAKGYQFTAAAENGKRSSVDLLEQIQQSFLSAHSNVRNLFVVMATYGHGKTHFALALANFFGKPDDSPEVGYILDNIEHAAGKVRATNLRDFKKNNAPLLVVRLFGDDPTNLPSQFINGLNTALKENPATENITLPFWFDSAHKFLKNRSTVEVLRANAFLEEHGATYDLPGLLRRLEQSDTTVYNICHDLFVELVGTPPNFGGEKPLKDIVEWAVDEFCGKPESGKAYCGLLVIMDEFIAFVQTYAEKQGAGNASALQNLLHGISNRTGKASFVALAQRDPEVTVDDIFKRGGISEVRLTDLKRELTRLPRNERYWLHSSLEFVLDSYLDQDEALYSHLREQALDALDDATEATMDLLPRYDKRNDWGIDKVDEHLTKGCFPLHPLTTGLLCTLQLSAGQVARNVLGFVLGQLKVKGQEPALITVKGQSRPNWVYPVALVDFFNDMMGDDIQRATFLAAQAAAGARLPVVAADTLKAIYLQDAAGIFPRTQDENAYAKLVSDLTGHSETDCAAALKSLSEQMVIEKDPVRPLYKFLQAGGASKVRALSNEIDRRIERKTVDRTVLERLTENGKTERLPRIEVNGLSAGNAIDYATHSILLTIADYNAIYLRGLAAGYRVDKQFIEGKRGIVVYILAKNDEEVEKLRTDAQNILDAAFPSGNPIPFIVARPLAPRPELEKRILRETAFGMMSVSEKSDYGQDACKRIGDRFHKDIDEDLKMLKADVEYLVPAPYRAAIALKAPQNKLDAKLRTSYELAYPNMPPSFRNQVPESNPSLRSGVKLVAEALITNEIRKHQSDIEKNALAKAIVKDFLQAGSINTWGIIGYTDQVQVPTNSRIKAAWDHLDSVFKPGTSNKPFKDGLLPLLNAPFGYDYNMVTLIFCAWFGFNRSHLRVEETGRLLARKELIDLLTTVNGKPSDAVKPADFIKGLCFTWPNLGLTRVDPTVAEKEVQEQIQRVKAAMQGTQPRLRLEEAELIRTSLLGSAVKNELSKALREEATKAAEQIASSLTIRADYIKREEQILTVIGQATNAKADEIILQIKQISSLPKLACVDAGDALSTDKLREMGMKKLHPRLDGLVAHWTKLEKIDDFKEKQTAIKNYQMALGQIDDVVGIKMLQDANSVLEAKRAVLQAEQEDKEALAYLEGLTINGAKLSTLWEIEERLTNTRVQSDKAKNKIAGVLKETRDGIVTLTQFADGMGTRLNTLTTVADARKLSLDITRKIDLYHGLDVGKELEAATDRCNQLEGAFTVLETPAIPKTPAEFADRIAALEGAVVNAGDSLSTSQTALFSVAIATLNSQMEQRKSSAIDWLEQLETKLKRLDPDLNVLLSELQRPQPFLPQEYRSRVELLIKELNDRRDANEVDAIINRFKDIKNPTVRKACLQQLIAYAEGIGEWK